MTAPETSVLVSSINLSIPAGWPCTGFGVWLVAYLAHNADALVAAYTSGCGMQDDLGHHKLRIGQFCPSAACP